jgi:hypothetical protein
MSLRLLALVVVVLGAAGSILLMLQAGSRQPSIVLIALFVLWVLSPFVALGWAAAMSGRWEARVRGALYLVIGLVTACSLAMYDGMIPMPAGARPAAVFLVVPFASWAFFAVLASLLRPRRENERLE